MLNGALVTGVRLPAFIVTLGTLNIAFALTHIVSNDITYPPGTSGASALPSQLLFFGRTFTDRAHRDHVRGRADVRAVRLSLVRASPRRPGAGTFMRSGDDPEAARLTGIKTWRVLLSVYTVAGLMYGIAAWLLVSRTELGDPNAGQTTENLDSITAVVLGGTSLFGGRGTVIGTLIGAIIVGVFRNGLTLIGVEVIYQYLVTGILVILAVVGRSAHAPEAVVSEQEQPILEARGLAKRYGQVVALDGVDFELYPDEIVAVIGDNGAGKSTLIKALSGALQPDEGEIRLDGKRVRFRIPGDARSAGIETVYQDLAVAPSLDIASNIFLGREARRRGPLGLALRMLAKRRCAARRRATCRSSRSASSRCGNPSRTSPAASARASRSPAPRSGPSGSRSWTSRPRALRASRRPAR